MNLESRAENGNDNSNQSPHLNCNYRSDFHIQRSTINVGLTLVEDIQNGNLLDNTQGGDCVQNTVFFG